MNDESQESQEPQIEVHRVLPQGGPGTLTAEESSAILEVAYLATAADDELADEELVAFRGLAGGLRALVAPPATSSDVTEHELDALLERFATNVDHVEPSERLVALAKVLARPVAKETAYKVAFAMALCDLAESDEEEDFDDELVAALGLEDDRADELASQVYEAIGGDEDEEDDEDEAEEEEDEKGEGGE